MRQSSRTSSFIGLALGLTILILIGTGFAGKPAKTYPEQGKVIANGTIGPPLGQTTINTHVYKVETDKAVFVLDCGKKPFFSRRGGECGGDQKNMPGGGPPASDMPRGGPRSHRHPAWYNDEQPLQYTVSSRGFNRASGAESAF